MKFLSPVRITNVSTIYLIIALPAMIALSFVMSPFGSNDEEEHFVRIVSIINGHSIPEVSYDTFSDRLDKRIAGGRIGGQVIAIEKEIDYGRSGVDSRFKMSMSKIELALRRYDDTDLEFSEHSNTALYPPLLYIAPIIAIAFAKLSHAPILLWLYAGRIANSLLSCGICWYAIKRGTGIRHVLIVLACLPIFLFQSASLSADALLLPLFLLFCSLVGRIAITSEASRRDNFLLAVVTLMISIGKIAYLPVALLPPFVVWLNTFKYSQRLRNLVGVLFASAFGWLLWAYIVHDKVFSMRPNVIVDPRQQLQLIFSQPLVTIQTFVASAFSILPLATIDSVGRKLGYDTVRIPAALSGVLLMLPIMLGFIKTENVRYKLSLTVSTVVISFMCFALTLVLLYLQFNPVGATFVSGMQGRYLAPLLVLICVFLPTLKEAKIDAWYTGLLPYFIGAISAYATVVISYLRYWVD